VSRKRWKRISGSEVLGLSINELLILITFALLLVMVLYFSELVAGRNAIAETEKLGETVRRLEGEAQDLARQLAALNRLSDEVAGVYFPPPDRYAERGLEPLLHRFLDEARKETAKEVLSEIKLPDIWTRLTILAAAVAEQQAFEKRLAELAKQAEEGQRAMDELEKAAKALDKRTQEFRTLEAELEASKAEQEELESELAALRKTLEAGRETLEKGASLIDRVREIEQEKENLRRQILNLQRRARAGGLDHPPCWPDEQGKPEYAFQVVVHEHGLTVTPVWPDARAEEAGKLTGGWRREESRTMSLGEFKQVLWVFREVGEAATPECRHFVEVVDATGPTAKAEWKSGLAAVEDVFYKLLVR